MYLRRLFSDKKIKLADSNGPSQMHLCCPVNDGSSRTAYKTCLQFCIRHKKRRLVKEDVVAKLQMGNSRSLISKRQKSLY